MRSAFEEQVPSGSELAVLFTELVRGRDLFSINECLQFITLQRTADELGRNKMFDVLREFVREVHYFEGESGQGW